MNANKDRQSGFSIVAIAVIAVLAVAILGYGCYRLYNHFHKPSASSSNQTSSNTTQTDPNAGYFVIKEWSVRFKPVGSINNIEYALRVSNNTAVFSTQQLTASDANCSAQATNYSGIGSITRTTTGSTAPFGGTLLITVNGYDYYYEGVGGASCITDSNNTAGRTLMQNEQTDFSDSIKSLEAAK